MNHNDTVTVSVGDAQAHNKVVHITDPWPRAASNTQITGNGQRVDRITKRYLSGTGTGSGGAASGASESPNSNAANTQSPASP